MQAILFLVTAILALTPAEFTNSIKDAISAVEATGSKILFFTAEKEPKAKLLETEEFAKMMKITSNLELDPNTLALFYEKTGGAIEIPVADLKEHSLENFHPHAFSFYHHLLQEDQIGRRVGISKPVAAAIGVGALGAGGAGGWFIKGRMDDQ